MEDQSPGIGTLVMWIDIVAVGPPTFLVRRACGGGTRSVSSNAVTRDVRVVTDWLNKTANLSEPGRQRLKVSISVIIRSNLSASTST